MGTLRKQRQGVKDQGKNTRKQKFKEWVEEEENIKLEQERKNHD